MRDFNFLPESLGTLETVGISGRTAEDIEFGLIHDFNFLPRLLRALEAARIADDHSRCQ